MISPVIIADESAALVPSLDLLPLSISLLPTLQAIFRATPTTNSVVSLVKSQYHLNNKQTLVA